MQLFWKQNKYAYNNVRYKPKRPDLGGSSSDPAGPIRETFSAVTPTSSAPDLSSSKTRPKTKIPLWIITYKPGPTRTLQVDRRCLDTPLSTFITGVSQVAQRSDIEKIKLTLSTLTQTTIIVISKDAKDAEDTWELAKKTFTAELKEVRAELKGEMRDYKILIKLVCVEHTLQIRVSCKRLSQMLSEISLYYSCSTNVSGFVRILHQVLGIT